MSVAVGAGTFLHHIQLQSRDPERLAKFYAGAMDMTARPLADAGGMDLRGSNAPSAFCAG